MTAYSRLGERARTSESVITRLMADKLARPGMLSLAAGFTDNQVLPEALVRRASGRLEAEGSRAHLQYGMNRGRPGLRRAVIGLLRGYPGETAAGLGEDDVMITNGSQQALYILVQLFCDAGDIVLVERPSYFVFLELLQGLGVRAVSIPSDDAGRIDPAALRALLQELDAAGELGRVKLAYVMGAFANPSTRCLSAAEKDGLAGVLRGLPRPVPVVEDMAYRELYFDAPHPVPSILSLDSWSGLPAIYVGTFTKPFATGLKVGFMVCRDRECLFAAANIKGHQDFGTANHTQAVIEEMLQAGEYGPHLAGIRAHYRHKRDLLERELHARGLAGAGWRWEQPQGGLLLWLRGPDGTDTRIGSAFHRRCVEQEVLYVPGDLCFAEGTPWNCVRLSFGALEGGLIPEAAGRFCRAALGA